MSKIVEQLQQAAQDLEEKKLDWREVKRIVIADLRNELARLRKIYDNITKEKK